MVRDHHRWLHSYDDRGNLHTITDGPDVTTYGFDAQNRLTSVSLPNTTTVSNDYDHDGRRIQQTVNTTETNYLWDEESRYGDVVLETDSGGNALASYVLADTRLISQERGSTILIPISTLDSTSMRKMDLEWAICLGDA